MSTSAETEPLQANKYTATLRDVQADHILAADTQPADTRSNHDPSKATRNTLAETNKHARDAHLTFDKDQHKYFWKQMPVPTSVTQRVKTLTQVFDPISTIARMRSTQDWPRPGYINKTKLLQLTEKEIQSLPSECVELRTYLRNMNELDDEDQLCQQLALLRYNHPDWEDWCQALTLTDREIIHSWKEIAAHGAQQGEKMHEQFEELLNGCSIDQHTPETRLLGHFLRQLSTARAYRTEWKIYSSAYNIAGAIDFVTVSPEGNKQLIDWKRTKNMKRKHEHNNKYMLHPLAHLPDCALTHYRLQLNMYKYILEYEYQQKVDAMYIVGTHPDNGETPWVELVPNLQREAKLLLQHEPSCKRARQYRQ